MKPEIEKSDKDMLILKFKPFDQGMLNLIKDALWKDSATQMAGFKVTHPEVGEALFTLRTKSKEAKAVWNAAIKNVEKECDDFAKELKAIKA